MKPVERAKEEKMRRALITAYREKERVDVGERWEMRVMHRIRSLAPAPSKTNFLEFFDAFFWRLAPIAVILIVVLVAALMQLNVGPEYDIAQMLMEDPADYSLWALLVT
jgi:hypothetical protein